GPQLDAQLTATAKQRDSLHLIANPLAPIRYFQFSAAHSSSPTAPGSSSSGQLRRMKRAKGRGAWGAGAAESWVGAREAASRVRNAEGRPCRARRISFRPRRSAIKMVAELKPLVDSSSSFRKRCGISLTDRYTRVRPPLAMKIVEVLTVTRCISCPLRSVSLGCSTLYRNRLGNPFHGACVFWGNADHGIRSGILEG